MKTVALSIVLFATPAVAADIALVGGDVHPVGGAVIPGGTVLVRGSKIARVGRDIAVPKGAQVIDCKGQWVTPGFIEVDSAIGLVEIDLVHQTVDTHPSARDPIRAAFLARDAIDPRSTLVGVARRHGVTRALSAPQGGLIAGRSSWVDLLDGPRALEGVSGPVAMHVRLGEGVGGSRAHALLKFREALDDARTYQRSRTAFNRRALYDLSVSRLDAEALQPVLTGRMPVVVQVSRASDIIRILEVAAQQRIRVILLGAEEGWMVAAQIAKARVPVIIEPLVNLPKQFQGRHARAENAALLLQAGVEVAISSRSSHNASSLRFVAGNAVRAGLPHEAALRAVTLAPARMFGAAREVGSLAAGRRADVVVWTGDPFEPKSFATHVLISGALQTTENRQTALARRYLERHRLTK